MKELTMYSRSIFALVAIGVLNTVACGGAAGEEVEGTDDALTGGSSVPSGMYRVVSAENVTTKITTYVDLRSNSGVSARLDWNPRTARFEGEGSEFRQPG